MTIDWGLYLVTDPDIAGGRDKVAGIVADAIEGGVSVVQLRDKNCSDDEFRAAAIEVRDAIAATGRDVPLFLNDRASIAAELGLHLHVGQTDMPYAEARALMPDECMVGLSVSTDEELDALLAQEGEVRLPDVIGIGCVKSTETKPDAPATLGVEGVGRLAARAGRHGIAAVAIGGVDVSVTADLARTAVDGVCVVSAIIGAPNPRKAAAQLRNSWERGRGTACSSVPRVLSIAGTDPTGGAGAQADIKAIMAAGGFALSAVTAVLAQNTTGVSDIHTPPLDVLSSQLDCVFTDVEVDAVKVGMLGTAEITRCVREYLRQHPVPWVVVDPVMVATSGDRLLDDAAEEELRALCAEADVITPNIPELAVLSGRSVATSFEDAVGQARELAEKMGTVILVKGGHLGGEAADNAVVTPQGGVHRIPVARVHTRNTHGTGCSLSSAVATRLAAGEGMNAAVEWSSEWLAEAISNADALAVGRGNGPVDHSHRARRLAAAAANGPWPELLRLPDRVTEPAGIEVAAGSYRCGGSHDDALPADEHASLEPAIAPAGEWTSALWASSRPVFRQIQQLPFIIQLGDGTLPERHFRFYLHQDAQYLGEYSRALAMLGVRAERPDDRLAWMRNALGCIEGEALLHRTWLADHPGEDLPATPITRGYTAALLASTSCDDEVVGACAVLPCFWLYAEVGAVLASRRHSEHPYNAWLSMYSEPEFVEECSAAIARVERLLSEARPTLRARALRAYLEACVHEREFFDQAHRYL